MSRKCIDKIQEWLQYMSPSTSELIRKHDEELIVNRNLPNGSFYKLHIWEEYDGSMVFQSLAFKAPSGIIDGELNIFQTLLMYNGFLEYVNFALTEIEPQGQWGVTLNSVHDCKRLTAAYVSAIIRSFDEAYIEFVPMLKGMAPQLGVNFTGQRRILSDSSFFRKLEDDDL